MKPVVAHFVRKKSQLKASFIKNQIEALQQFRPVIICKLYENINNPIDGGFSDFDEKDYPILSLAETDKFFDRFIYRCRKIITTKDVKLIGDFISRHHVELLHFHFGHDAGVYLPKLTQIKIPKIVSFYGFECSGFPSYLWGYGKYYLNKRVFKHADIVLAMTEDMKKDLIGLGCAENKIIVHYYGTDTREFKAVHHYPPKKPVNFSIVSGLIPKKGHLFLLKAFEKAVRKNKNIQLKIVGDGPTGEVIKNYVRKNGFADFVKFYPRVKYASAEHKRYFAKADVFVHPSVTGPNGDKEGIPGAIIEAMAAGLPVISTYHAGIPHVIEHNKTGMLVQEWDIDQLTNYILEIAQDSEKRNRIAIAGQKYALGNLDLVENEKELEQIYQSVRRDKKK